ncbi:MAG: MFS transporter [Dongiaceae bacterium]
MTEAAATAPPDRRGGVFAHRDYVLYLAASLLMTVAAQMQAVGIAWQVYDLTGDPLYLGLVGLAEFLPAIAFGLIAGHCADRFDRRLVGLVALGLELACAAALVGLAAGGVARVWPFLAVAFGFGIARTFQRPAAGAMLPMLIPPGLLPQGVAWSSAGWQVAVVGGPALGGVVFVLGAGWVYAATVLVLAAALLLWLLIRPPGATAAGEGLSWDSIAGGVRMIRRSPILLGAISLDLFAVLFGGATALLPVYARDILHVGPEGLGLLRSAPAAGAVLVGLLLARRPLARGVGLWLFGCVALFGAATIVFGLSGSLWLSLAALAVLGAADMVSVFIRSTLVPLATPPALLGRVMAVEQIFIGASNELGAAESGFAAALIGTVPTVVLGGIATLAVVAAWWGLFPALRRVDRLDRRLEAPG